MKKLLTILLFAFTLHSGAQNIWYAPSVFKNDVTFDSLTTGSTTRVSKVTIKDTLRYVPNAGIGKLLQSDATGNARWTDTLTGQFSYTGTPVFNSGIKTDTVKTITPSTTGYVLTLVNDTTGIFTNGLWAASGNNIYNTNSANVGIGTSSPDNKLTVLGGFLDSATTTYGYSAIHCGAFNIGLPKEGIYATNGYSRLQMTYDEDQPNKTNWHWVLGSEKSKIEGDSTASSGYGTGELRMKFTDGDSYYFDGGSFYSFSGIGTLGNTDNHWFGLYTDGLKLTDGTQANGYVLTSDGSGNATWQTPDSLSHWAANGNDIYNTNSGNVGIGTAAPIVKFNVNAHSQGIQFDSAGYFYLSNLDSYQEDTAVFVYSGNDDAFGISAQSLNGLTTFDLSKGHIFLQSQTPLHNNKLTIDTNGLNYTDGTQANGYVLTSDASGNATWQNPHSLRIVSSDLETIDSTSNGGTVSINNSTNNWTVYLPSAGAVPAGFEVTINRLNSTSTGTIDVTLSGAGVISDLAGTYFSSFALAAWGSVGRSMTWVSDGNLIWYLKAGSR